MSWGKRAGHGACPEYSEYTRRELRRLPHLENNPDALVLVDNVYHRIAGISRDDGLIILQDAERQTRNSADFAPGGGG